MLVLMENKIQQGDLLIMTPVMKRKLKIAIRVIVVLILASPIIQ